MLTSLISNLQKMTKDGKESYFGKRWGAETGFRKNVNRKDFMFEDIGQASPSQQLNDVILTRYQQTPDTDRTSFVEKITQDSLDYLAKRQGMRVQQLRQAALVHESMTCVIGRIFARIEAYSLELNAYLGCTDLHTVVTRPSHVREVTRYSKTRHPIDSITFYRARIGTHAWSLVMRGREGHIEFYLLPVERVMGLSKTEALYEPIATIDAEVVTELETVDWLHDERPLSSVREEQLCMELFAKLISATKEAMDLEARVSHLL